MAVIATVIGGVAIGFLYDTAFEEERIRLHEEVQIQALLLEAISEIQNFNNEARGSETSQSMLARVINTQVHYQQLKGNGRFSLVKKENESIAIILEDVYAYTRASNQNNKDNMHIKLSYKSPKVESMRRALNGQSGTMISIDRNNTPVLVGYEPLPSMDMALIGEIELEEIRKPFYQTGRVIAVISFFVIFIGSIIFNRISSPIVRHIKKGREQLSALARHLHVVREEERKWISHEIHDELGSSLAKLKMDAFWLQRNQCSENERYGQRIGEMSKLIDETIQSVRRITTTLRPVILDQFGLLPALQWQAQDFEKHAGISCIVVPHSLDIKVDKDTKVALFRIAQEALTNVANHAKAEKVTIEIYLDNDHYILKIEDNGRGFDKDHLTLPTVALGLRGMEVRSHMFQGDVSIESSPGVGTTVRILIPKTVVTNCETHSIS
ncbi:MAG: sensor histidine kinase [Magnetococcales bacterium]|nr:sensor histidine kinase [Magnetococcales bacterium]